MPTETRVLTQHRHLSWWQAVKFAGRRALWTMSVGLSVAAIWVFGLLAAPQIEARYFPAVSDFKLLPDKAKFDDPSILAFRVAFTKNCDCQSLGRSWFFQMSDGTMIRVQAQLPEGIASPSSRPPGRQIGRLMMLRIPDPREGVDEGGRPVVVEATAVIGTSTYDRNLPWTSQVTIGPYPIDMFRHPDATPIPQHADAPEIDGLP